MMQRDTNSNYSYYLKGYTRVSRGWHGVYLTDQPYENHKKTISVSMCNNNAKSFVLTGG